MIEVKGITKYYGSFKALDDVSFHVSKGEVLGFLGPNGAGKSTTMKVLTTFISASEGTASVAGHDVHVSPLEVRKRIGYLPETPPLYGDMTVEHYLNFAGRARGLGGHELKDRLQTVVNDCGLRNKLKSRIVELSKGFKQRTGLAQALIHNPDVLILDEPTSGLDPMQIVEIRKLINRLREGRCIIFSTHILQEATAVADRLVIINGGKVIADGSADELSAKAADVQAVRVLVKGATSAFAEVLRNTAGVQAVEMQSGPNGYGRFQLRVGGGARGVREACEMIADTAHARGLKVAELAPEKLTLEQVFLQLLSKASQTAPGQPGKEASKPRDAVSGNLPPDLDATAAATRISGEVTSAESYSKASSETSWETGETRIETDKDDVDDFGTVRDLRHEKPGSDTEYSPRLPDKEDS
jgi:ABC-2 type transport system ATP-binding protein